MFTIIICIFIYYINNKKERFENSDSLYDKVYISFTTIPSRIAYIDEMLKSVDIPEVYEIHLNLQSEFEYPEKEIERLKSITPKLKIFWSTGKYIIMSKSIPTLERLLGTYACVLAIDDDFVYGRDFVKAFINSYNPYVKEIIGGKILTIAEKECKFTDILRGGYGILYPMRIITKEIVDDMKNAGKLSISCYRAEDITSRTMFYKYGINIREINNLNLNIKELNYSHVDAVRLFTHPPEYVNGYNYNNIQCCNAINKHL